MLVFLALIFVFGLRMYFQTGQVFFVPEWPKGEFVSISGLILDKITCVCKDDVNRDSTIQSFLRRLCTARKIEDFGSLSAVRTIEPSRPDPHLTTVPSVQTTYHTVQMPVRPSIIRPDDVHFRPDPPLCLEVSIQLAFVRTSQQHIRTSVSLGPDARATNMEIADSTSIVRTTASHGPDARIADTEIAC
jgi:hypothetical protein